MMGCHGTWEKSFTGCRKKSDVSIDVCGEPVKLNSVKIGVHDYLRGAQHWSQAALQSGIGLNK